MANGIEANNSISWLDQTIQKIEWSVADGERTDRLVSQVARLLTSIEVSSDLKSVDGLNQFSQALKERNPEAGRRTQGLVDDLAACILGKEGAELALAIRMKDTDKILELDQLPETLAGRQRVARAILETPSQEFSPDLINLLRDISPEDLAQVINAYQIPLKFLNKILGDQQEDTVLKLAPYLTYADFRGLDSGLQKKLLDNCSPNKLNQLFIQSEKIETLPAGMGALQHLDCGYCFHLASLPNGMAALQSLCCPGCLLLSSLPGDIATLQTLDCSSCWSLASLPEDMTALQSLNCSHCNSLASLPEDMAALQSLNCSYCNSLASLPEDMAALQKLSCYNCNSLASLPVALPQCTYLDFMGCPQLENTPTPEMPANAAVYRPVANNHHQQSSWSVPYIEVPNDPKGFLCLLGERWLIKGFPFPSIAYKEENGKAFQGIDFGGVRRDLVSRIITHLFNGMLEPGNSLKRSVDGFPLWQDEDEKQVTAYLSLARLMALCYQHVCNLTTGPMFSPHLYQALLTDAESLDRAAALLDLDPDLIQLAMDVDSPFPKDLSDSVKASVLQYLDPNEDNFKSDCYEQRINMAMEHLKQYRDSLLAGIQDEMFSEKCNWNQINQVIDHLQGELKVALGEQTWEEIKKKGAAHLQKEIEGELSAEALWAHLDWDYGKSSQAEIEQTKAYFKHWILNASYQELQDFVRAVTGNRALTPKRPTIQLFRRGPAYLPIAHSCSSELEASSQLADQATFDKKMEQFLAHALAGSGFQMP